MITAALLLLSSGVFDAGAAPARRLEVVGDDAIPTSVIAQRFGADVAASAADIVIVAFAEEVPEARGAFMARAHALLDDVRRENPRAWIVIASAPTDLGANWANAIVMKRGDGKLSWVRSHEAGVVGDEIAKRMRW